MASDEHVALLKQGSVGWNLWPDENRNVLPDLGNANLSELDLWGADLSKADLHGADLRGADLGEADLFRANLFRADLSLIVGRAGTFHVNLSRANLSSANLGCANLTGANLSGANLIGASLVSANLRGTDFREADLSIADLSSANFFCANFNKARLNRADLYHATLVDTDFTGADLTGCRIYGVSAWGLKLERAMQQDQVITRFGEPRITVDNIEVAQFIYLMLHNEKVRDVIDTITSKALLILGRFSEERKAVLQALREELRKRNYLPILFDFEKPRSRDTDETITLLARMARFVVADISDAKSVLQELRGIVPDLPSVPVQPIILAAQEEPGMFDFYRNRPSFLSVHRYTNQEQLLADLGEKVIRPAELKVLELRG